MDPNQKVFKAALKLCSLMDKATDEALPQEIAGVVKLHSKLAVGSAWIPIPGADIAAGAASIWGMYIRINSKLEMPFSENITKSIGSGVATNLASYLAVSGVGSVIKIIPGIGTITGAVLMSASMYAATLASGYIYLQALTALFEQKKDINDTSLTNAINIVLGDKSTIQEFIQSAKSSYKK